jgi:hypothetical protein
VPPQGLGRQAQQVMLLLLLLLLGLALLGMVLEQWVLRR